MADPAATRPFGDEPSTGDVTQKPRPDRPLYGGFSRFELELEFVQSLANPYYLNHLASQKVIQDPSFTEYLRYLQYFTQPTYTRYLSYPAPSLKALQLLQQEKFRQDILSPDVVARLANEWLLASIKSQ
ncbi:MAG: hypothetical protein LQ344_002797 [Seirophora lacunosa]|nr:MAG: hypothetical protein LQ344_002797 [Seirophora lacunosa]